jgi:hypothetical protein
MSAGRYIDTWRRTGAGNELDRSCVLLPVHVYLVVQHAMCREYRYLYSAQKHPASIPDGASTIRIPLPANSTSPALSHLGSPNDAHMYANGWAG